MNKMRDSISSAAQSFQEFLATKAAHLISTLASGLGIASFAGFVSLWVGILSSIWLVVQLYNYFTFTRPKNLREKARWKSEMESEYSDNSSRMPLSRISRSRR